MHYLYIFYHIPIKRIKRNCVRKFRKISSKASRKQKKKEKSISNPKSKETTRKTVSDRSENRSKRTPTPGIHAHSTLSKPNRVMHAHPFIKNKLQKRDVRARAAQTERNGMSNRFMNIQGCRRRTVKVESLSRGSRLDQRASSRQRERLTSA